MTLEFPPEPLSRRQRTIVLALALVCAATRFLALARSFWDWDEALFLLGMRDYDVTQHHPHPPGFPVYLGMARLLRLAVADDFRALQGVNLLAAVLVFPALFLFARELRLRFETSVLAAALFAFFPNVWFFGGGAFSDVPSIVLVLFAVTFLLRGVRDPKSYLAGTFLLALAIGIRPQNLLLGLVPGLLATRRRRPREIAAALLLGVTIVALAFGGAIHATGSYDGYMEAVRSHGDYIARVDSWRSDVRPPMWRLFDRFFIKQYQSPPLSILATLFVIAAAAGSIRQRSRPMLVNVLTFAPFAIVAWMMLDRFSISRFSIGYQPMFAILAADGIHRAARFLARRFGTAALPRIETAIAAVVVGAFFVYTLPALTPVRNELAPSLVATRAVAQHLDPRRDSLFVGHTMSKFVDLTLPGRPYIRVLDDRALPLSTSGRSWILAERTKTPEEGFVFRRERGRLWNIARRHYFDVKLAPLTRQAQFVSGWHEAESEGIEQWRWMTRHSVTILPPQHGDALLRLHLAVPAELLAQNP
ncbi:MAG TPA: hypothetical protein VFO89_16880, partial [Thermoanaerobaculia bacterium]|nr:hypothetical protein [Thermoanaerobaculia bacterium]